MAALARAAGRGHVLEPMAGMAGLSRVGLAGRGRRDGFRRADRKEFPDPPFLHSADFRRKLRRDIRTHGIRNSQPPCARGPRGSISPALRNVSAGLERALRIGSALIRAPQMATMKPSRFEDSLGLWRYGASDRNRRPLLRAPLNFSPDDQSLLCERRHRALWTMPSRRTINVPSGLPFPRHSRCLPARHTNWPEG